MLDFFINEPDIFLAHLGKNDGRKESLSEHCKLSKKYLDKIIEAKGLEPIIQNIGHTFFEGKSYELFREMFQNAVYFHDLGKVNKNFQAKKMKNPAFRANGATSNHSFLGAKFYIEYYFDRVCKLEDANLLSFLFLNSYLISSHHSTLGEFGKYLENLKSKFEEYENYQVLGPTVKAKKALPNLEGVADWCRNYLFELENETSWTLLTYYVYSKLLFSLLVSSDFYATYEFMNEAAVDDFGLFKDIEPTYSAFKQNDVYKKIKEYEHFAQNGGVNPFADSPINALRSELFLEAQKKLVQNFDKHNIFYLKAPTGSGKTNAALNLSFKLLELDKNLNKIFYVFPFNTLVEQTGASLEDCLGKDIVQKFTSTINSITPITKNDDETSDYEKYLLDRQFLHSEIILTTHVNFFTHLFGTCKQESFPLAQIANSVVVIDEIQAYKNSIWKEFAIFLEAFARLLNIKIIIMSATLPMLDKLCDGAAPFCSLIKNPDKYFQNPLFKNRVELDFSMLSEFKEDELIKKALFYYEKGKKVLIEFINKKTAFDFFKKISQSAEVNVELLTGDDNIADRKDIINSIKCSLRPIILVSTQVIEAGVDVDFDIGFKDVSILDSEEQFLGRINRSCKKCGKAYFFNHDDAQNIYKKDVRAQKAITLEGPEIQELLREKCFDKYYDKVLEQLNICALKNNSGNIDDFRKYDLANLKYNIIQERLRLIAPEADFTIFLNRKIEIDGQVIDGKELWQAYKDIASSKDSYAKKKIRLSLLMSKMSCFTYRVRKKPSSYTDVLGGIFYVEEGEKYFTEINGKMKFDRQKYDENGISYEFI